MAVRRISCQHALNPCHSTAGKRRGPKLRLPCQLGSPLGLQVPAGMIQLGKSDAAKAQASGCTQEGGSRFQTSTRGICMCPTIKINSSKSSQDLGVALQNVMLQSASPKMRKDLARFCSCPWRIVTGKASNTLWRRPSSPSRTTMLWHSRELHPQ